MKKEEVEVGMVFRSTSNNFGERLYQVVSVNKNFTCELSRPNETDIFLYTLIDGCGLLDKIFYELINQNINVNDVKEIEWV